MPKIQILDNVIKEDHYFTFYNGILSNIQNDIIAANIIVTINKKGKHKYVTIFERNPKNNKIKICDIFEDEINKIKSEFGIYIQPKNIKTISGLKKAIIYDLSL